MRDLLKALDDLPPESLREVATFVDYQRFKLAKHDDDGPPDWPIALGGILKGVNISDEDIEDARREMWARFADPDR